MKLIHTADWHLGQTFYEYDRREEHTCFIKWLKEQVRIVKADALLIAGDIFDSPNPSAESQRMFYTFLREVTDENPDLQIVIIAGNHDSAARLEAPAPLLEDMNIIVKGVVRKDAEGKIDFQHLIVPLYVKGQLAAYCLAVPYLRQGDYPEAKSYALGVRCMYESLYRRVKQEGVPVIAMGHMQVTGSEISENDHSERTIIGGLECVSPDSFDPGIAYTALGHLHRSQRVSKREDVRYSGTPIPMSFAEKNNKHGVVCVTIEEENCQIEMVEFVPPVRLISMPREAKILSEVLSEVALLPEDEITDKTPYLEIKVLIKEPEPSLRYRLEEALRNKAVRLARIVAIIPQQETENNRLLTCEELQAVHPFDIATDVFKKKFGGQEMPENMKELLQSVIREVQL